MRQEHLWYLGGRGYTVSMTVNTPEEKLNALDLIRVQMVKRHVKPEYIRPVTADYLKQRKKLGLPTL